MKEIAAWLEEFPDWIPNFEDVNVRLQFLLVPLTPAIRAVMRLV
jgi:hypothetical protein